MEKNFDNHLKEKIHTSDCSKIYTKKLKDEIWESVDGKNTNYNTNFFIRIAASILLIGGISIFLFRFYSEGEAIQITYSTEIGIDFQKEDLITGDEGTTFIKSRCKQELSICKTPEFRSLLHELEVTEQEIEELDTMINNYGYGPELVKSKIDLENFKSEITQKMILMILS
ncbi:MAG: hypothetical protein AAF363_11175 [Bacteroidota bacterium]